MQPRSQSTSLAVPAGWKRNALQVNYFAPWDLLQPDPSFLSMVNRVLVPPILQTLVFSAAPEEVRPCLLLCGWHAGFRVHAACPQSANSGPSAADCCM